VDQVAQRRRRAVALLREAEARLAELRAAIRDVLRDLEDAEDAEGAGAGDGAPGA